MVGVATAVIPIRDINRTTRITPGDRPMSAVIKTKFVRRQNPFTGESTLRKIEPADITVSNDPLPGRRIQSYKYDDTFNAMTPGQCIVCPPEATGTLGNAMRHWIERQGRQDELCVRSVRRYPGDGNGRVWLLPKHQKPKVG
jgi:hypothetical protein